MNKKITILTIALISVFILINLGGCTAGFVKPVAGSPTMADTYQAAAKGENTFYQKDNNSPQKFRDRRSRINLPEINNDKNDKNDNSELAAKYASVLDSQFPKLPNPENLMYIFGHYADQGDVPVPGHFVTFSMYEKDHYALPDEIQEPYNDGQFMR